MHSDHDCPTYYDRPFLSAAERRVAALETKLQAARAAAQSTKEEAARTADLLRKEQEARQTVQSRVAVVENDLDNPIREYD